MFGRRADGRLLKEVDPIIALTPYLMPMRCDAQVFLDYKLDFEKLTRYIVAKGNEGYKFTFMELLIAAYVRTVSEFPEANRFIANKRLYARTQLAVSFALLKDSADPNAIEENTVKCLFDPRDTIYDVSARVSQAIAENRREEADNSTLKLAKLLLNPLLANTIVSAARFLDRYGIMPKYILNASPFHTSLFVTNMASIGMPAVKHHIYNFGTTSVFFSIGAVERTVVMGSNGQPVRKRYLPIGITADERICAGAMYARFVDRMMKLLNDPQQLELPPESVRFEEGNEYSLPAVKKSRFRRKKKEEKQQKEIAG
ncbi:MAG: 2-oxo acid dehydrogenase subunit E2 [Clostridia bacterium]|nr:2-oxo acid dehydrogenase subunit E2 [Clostridia bacterium]MBQ6805690.1 2-oxo acid dehydrogenase subunit E2 [Clostridia bacterium]